MKATNKQVNIDLNDVFNLAKSLIENANSYYIKPDEIIHYCIAEADLLDLSNQEVELALSIAIGKAMMNENSRNQKTAAYKGIVEMQNTFIKNGGENNGSF
jgi:hypothetical protein